MASQYQVKQYLAHWFQLGKKVVLHNGQATRLPQPVIQMEQYSPEFEACWQEILTGQLGDCYLEGTEQTITELLSSAWEIDYCARCQMPIPMHTRGMPPNCCPCFSLKSWPNLEVPLPRLPIDTQHYLLNLCDRLTQGGSPESPTIEADAPPCLSKED